MRRILIAILCILLLTTAVSAADSVSNLQSNTTVATDGTCQVSLVMQLNVDSGGDLQFPLPANAKDITLNGDRAKTNWSNSQRWVDLSTVVYGPGNYTLSLHYSLPDSVTEEKTGLVLTLPLLSGFSCPIQQMEFSVTLPKATEEYPVFASTYYKDSVEAFMNYTIQDGVISGQMLQEMKGYETLTMTLPVTADMFPQTIAKRWSLSNDDLIQYALTLLAAAYWLIFLRCKLPHRIRRLQPPNGMTAGELGCCFAGQGVDFPAMVLSWAQMGYLTIHVERSGRVLLHKDMDMGNERSEFEVRTFKKLFGKRQTVDAASEHVALLGKKVSKSIPGAWHYFKQSSGNPMIFRLIATAIGAVAGSSMAAGFATDTVWIVVLSIFLVPLGGVLSWLMQTGIRGIQLRHKMDLFVALGCGAVWFILGSLAGEWHVMIYVLITQILAGFGAVYGGRRTEEGLQARNEILGLRKYLKTIPAGEVKKIIEHNPDYYFAMAPYAVALGVDKAFARQFQNGKLSPCPYLLLDGREPKTALQWNEQMRLVMKVMDDRRRKLPLEKLLGK